MSLAIPSYRCEAASLGPQRRFPGFDVGLVRHRTGWGFCVRKRTLGWAGLWITVAVLFGGCQDPGPAAAPTTPAQSGNDTPGSATLSWEAPTTNTNGTALTDLVGYHIYYGSNPQELSRTVQINTVGLQTYVIDDLEPGTWYFAIKAVAANGVESTLSEVAVKTIS